MDKTNPPIHVLRIEQSGRYFQVVLGAQSYPMKLAGEQVLKGGPRAIDQLTIRLVNGGIGMTFEGRPGDSDEYLLTCTGVIQGTWRAVRIDTPYPRRAAARPATRPATRSAPGAH
jgi:hypothetical protein